MNWMYIKVSIIILPKARSTTHIQSTILNYDIESWLEFLDRSIKLLAMISGRVIVSIYDTNITYAIMVFDF